MFCLNKQEMSEVSINVCLYTVWEGDGFIFAYKEGLHNRYDVLIVKSKEKLLPRSDILSESYFNSSSPEY